MTHPYRPKPKEDSMESWWSAIGRPAFKFALVGAVAFWLGHWRGGKHTTAICEAELARLCSDGRCLDHPVPPPPPCPECLKCAAPPPPHPCTLGCRDKTELIRKDHWREKETHCWPGQETVITQGEHDWLITCRCPKPKDEKP